MCKPSSGQPFLDLSGRCQTLLEKTSPLWIILVWQGSIFELFTSGLVCFWFPHVLLYTEVRLLHLNQAEMKVQQLNQRLAASWTAAHPILSYWFYHFALMGQCSSTTSAEPHFLSTPSLSGAPWSLYAYQGRSSSFKPKCFPTRTRDAGCRWNLSARQVCYCWALDHYSFHQATFSSHFDICVGINQAGKKNPINKNLEMNSKCPLPSLGKWIWKHQGACASAGFCCAVKGWSKRELLVAVN